ncbi:MAG: choice-of-anchor D domain-containing protein [Bacteroidetes bacterium]|nr:choice-of-anchor D domain-containing protein [Bacteroidota bacterium]
MARIVSPLATVLLFILTSLTLQAQTGLWVKENIPAGLPVLRDIDMHTDRFGIAVGASNINPAIGMAYSGVMLTSNGGAIWNAIESNAPRFKPDLPEYTSWHGVHIVDEQTAIIVGDSCMIYRTTDGGQLWEEIPFSAGGNKYLQRPTLHDVYMVDYQKGVIVGGDNLDAARTGGEWHPAMVYRTTDAGLSWNDASPAPSQINNNPGALRRIDYAFGTYLYGGEYGLLLTDQGGNFQLIEPINSSGLFAVHWWDVSIKSPFDIIVVGTNWTSNTPLAYRSIRYGTRYASMVPGNIVNGVTSINSVDFLDIDNGWIGSSQQYLALTNDNGVSWTSFHVGSTPTYAPMTGISMVNPVLGWACGGTEGSNDAYIAKFLGSPPKADISTSDALVDFGNVECEKYIEKELFLRNSGTGDLRINIGDITFTSPEFSVVNTQDFPLTIRPKRSASVLVRWTPARGFSGDLGAGMYISSNDPDHVPWQVELRGKRSHGILDLLPEYGVSYGTCLGDTLYYDMPVYTAGNRIPTFIKYEFVSGHNDYKIISPAAGSTIKDYANFKVRFAPLDSAMRIGVYRFIHGDPTCPDTTLVSFSGLGQLSVVRASADTIDFGQICKGQVKDTTITLKNLGNTFANVGILSQVSGDPLFSSPDYAVFLLQDSSKTYRLRFAPTGAGKFEGKYRATYGLCTDTLFFTFRGEGLETELEFNPKTPVRIGPIFANRIAAKTITISNPGKTPAHITNIRFSKIVTPLQFSSKPNLPLTLAPGQATSVTVRFSPVKVGDYNTSIIVDWDARCADTAAVDIEAVCVANPAIEAPTSADLGIQRCPAPLRDTIMIRNNGNGPLVFYSISVTGPDFQHFNVIQPAINDTAKAGSSYPMIVEFNRTTEGRSDAIIRLTHNDFEAGRTDIAVTAQRTIAEYAVEGDSATAFFTRLFVPETRQFTVRNVGSQPLTVTDVRVVKAATVFGVTPLQTLPRTLAPNQTMQFEVTFTPNARGPFTGIIEVESDPCSNVHTLKLTGSGDTDGLSADRGDIDFALDPCSFSAVCEDIVLKNQSPEPVEVLGLSITQSGTAFSIDPAVATPFVLASNAEKTVRICASPTVSGIETGTLVISSNDPAYPTLSVALRASRDSSGITVSESAIDFGRLADCMPATPRRVTILNTGDLRETVSFAFLNGGNGFSATVSGPETINAGRPLSFDISFTRPSYGTFDDVLVITTQLCGTEFRIPLHAESVKQEYLAAPNPLTFPTVNVGGANNRQFTLQNQGGFDASIARVEIQPAGVFTVTGTVPTSVGAGSTENITLRFNPTSEGDFTATACVIISAPCPDTVCISLEGSAVRGTLDVHPPMLAFGSKAQCESGILYDTLVNSGSGPITILSADITGTGSAAFINQTPVTVPEVVGAGSIRIFEILYDAALAPGDGAVTAALTVRTNDAVLPQFDIQLEAQRVTLRVDAGGSVDFGPVQVANPEVRTVTLRNTGSTPLCYTTASFPAQLTVVPAPPFCIDPGNTLDLTLTFTATSSGLFNGRLALQVDAPCADSTIFTLRAQGQQGTLTQVDTIDLGSGPWCVPGSAQFNIASTYLEAVTLESVRLEGADAAFFSIISPDPATLPQPIASGGSLSVQIDFAGEQLTRDYTATFVSSFTAFGSAIERRTVLRVHRSVPTLTLGSASFPAMVLGQSAGTRSITITNTSEIPLTVSAATVQLPDFIVRSLTPAPPAILQPGGSMTAVIEFIPTAVGQFTDSLLVISNAPCSFRVSGLLTGEGIPQPIVNAVLSIGSIQAKQDAIIDIPILTDKDLGPAAVNGWSGSISFNRSMLWPMEMVKTGSLSAGMQVGFTYDNTNGVVNITATGGTVAAGTGALAWLRCRVLIGDALTTPLRMSTDFGFMGGYASVAGRVDGTFELIEYCLPGDRLLNVEAGLLLRQNTPNPVELSRRTTTSISYTLPQDAAVSLDIYDMIGRKLRHLDQGHRTKGTHTMLLDVSDLRQGAYMYVLRTSNESAIRRMVVIP